MSGKTFKTALAFIVAIPLVAVVLSPSAVFAQSVSQQGRLLWIDGTNRSETIYISFKNYGTRRRVSMVEVKITDDVGRVFEESFFAFQVDYLLVSGFKGNDTIINNTNIPSTIYGHEGNDTLYGGYANDYLWGGKGGDILYGGYGNDDLYGGQGVDDLYGGYGSDKLDAGPYNNWPFLNELHGGPGLDEYWYNNGDGIYDPEFSDDNIYLDSPQGLPEPDEIIPWNGKMILREFLL